MTSSPEPDPASRPEGAKLRTLASVICRELRPKFRDHLARAHLALAPRRHDRDDEGAAGLAVLAHDGDYVVDHAIFPIGRDQALDLGHGGVGEAERRAGRRLDGDEEDAAVLIRGQLRRQILVERPRHPRECCGYGEDDQRCADRARQHDAVTPRQPPRRAVDDPREAALVHPWLQHEARDHRTERERHECRQRHGDRQRDAELAEELADLALQERQRHEDRDQDGRSRHDGEEHLVRAGARGLLRVVTFFHPPLDVLEHNDGVVHHEADGEDQREECQDVDREANDRNPRAGAKKRDGNRHSRHDGRADGGEEEVDHRDHDRHRDGERRQNLPDRVSDEVGVVRRDPKLGATRKRRRNRLDFVVHGGRDGQGIGRRLPEDAETDGGLAVGAKVAVVALGPDLDAGDVAERDAA